jgi:DNA (cytosine-5)-methyltransferase 1
MTKLLRSLDLFSGVGGFSYALKNFAKPIAFCDNDSLATQVLRYRMLDGVLPEVPIFENVINLTSKDLSSKVDLITAGFPCQDVSEIGSLSGINGGKRTKLVHEVLRLAKSLNPSYLFFENVSAIVKDKDFPILLDKITRLGYDWSYDFFAASSEGALHRRDRWYLLAERQSPSAKTVIPKCGQHLWDDLSIRETASCDNRHTECFKTRKFGKLYGNALVPAVACRAFVELHSRLQDATPKGDLTSSPEYRTALQLRGTLLYSKPRRTWTSPVQLKAVWVSPSVKRKKKSKNTQPLISKSYKVYNIPTPRTILGTGVLTERTTHDLGPVVISSDLTLKSLRGKPEARVRIPFLENLMGFPVGWSSPSRINQSHPTTLKKKGKKFKITKYKLL